MGFFTGRVRLNFLQATFINHISFVQGRALALSYSKHLLNPAGGIGSCCIIVVLLTNPFLPRIAWVFIALMIYWYYPNDFITLPATTFGFISIYYVPFISRIVHFITDA